MIRYVVPAERERVFREYLEFWGRDMADRAEILHCESLARAERLEGGTYILAALDQMGPATERLVRELYDAVAGNEGFRFLNHPTRTLRRFDLLAELDRRDRNAFGAVRAAGDLSTLRYPVFLREERAHDGAISPLLSSAKDLEAGIGRALVQGYRLKDLLVIEYLDTADASGFYRKYAAFTVGRQVIARSLACGRRWMLKFQGTDWSRAMVEEELDYVVRNPHAAELAEIFEIAGVEYGRIDYAMKDGRVQTWEINLNPGVGRGLGPSSGRVPDELQPIRQELKVHFYGLFKKALQAVDLPVGGGAAVPFVLDPGTSGAVLSQRIRSKRIVGTLPRALRPARPLLEPLAAPLLRMLGRLARETGAPRS